MAEKNNQIICPDCGVEINKPEEIMVGDILECQECATEVEILSLDPLKFRELIEEK